MSKKTGAFLVALILIVCAAAVGLANENVFTGTEELDQAVLEDEGEGPPSWAPEHARKHWEWSITGDGGPPPWAPKHARENWERSEDGEGGPPPWAPKHARENWERSEDGEDGPPPWARGKGKNLD